MARILLLSEDRADLALYTLILEQEGYDCITAITPQETLSHLQTLAIDVLYIIDILSFSFDGLEFYTYLKSEPQLGKIPVIIYTPWFPTDLKPNPTDYGDTLFLMPINIRVFREKVKELTGLGKE